MFDFAPFQEALSVVEPVSCSHWGNLSLFLLAKQKLRPGYQKLTSLEAWLRAWLHLHQSEYKLAHEAQQFWTSARDEMSQHSHWRGHGIFTDDERWQALGREHLDLYQEFAPLLNISGPLRRIVEWGCGGGANAVHFAPLAQDYVGIDVCEASLKECARQIARVGQENFTPILIQAFNPEEALVRVPSGCDLFLATYVFEAFPTPEYGYRVLNLASRMLRAGGAAIVQIKYQTAAWTSWPKRFGYRRNFTTMTTYRIDEFWEVAAQSNLVPKAVRLIPRQPLNGNGEYAYFILTKGDGLAAINRAAAPRRGQQPSAVHRSRSLRPGQRVTFWMRQPVAHDSQ